MDSQLIWALRRKEIMSINCKFSAAPGFRLYPARYLAGITPLSVTQVDLAPNKYLKPKKMKNLFETKFVMSFQLQTHT